MPNDNRQIIEIGPGLGDLTKEILVSRDVIAYEVDKDLIPILKNRFENETLCGKLSLICTDVLEFWDKNDTLYDGEYNLVANLPYYISSTIILRALKDKNCKHILVMTQKEVAQKFCADSGVKEFCALSVLADSMGDANILFDVPNSAFHPVPKVTSSVLLIKKSKEFEITDEYEEFLRVCFKQPRKTLMKNLAQGFVKDILVEAFLELNIDTNLRPHQLETFHYHLLFNKLIRNEDGRSFKVSKDSRGWKNRK
jgi:16S rRNA (adenine1518-N6/adenine1519-N6)-dimethyltransferase